MKASDTHAIIVGIESYKISPAWNLNGPAADAARFARWLLSRDVPNQNITMFVAPLEVNRSALTDLDVMQKAADHNTIMEAITGDFTARRGELLMLFWGSHGVIGGDSRRLFFSDVTENYLLNIDFASVLRFLRSVSLSGFPKQMCFVDACSNYFELLQSPVSLADVPVRPGLPKPHVSQFALFAASAGERAANLNAMSSGLFSSILLEELEKSTKDQWPPDAASLRKQIEEIMLQLRVEGKAKQTPVHYQYQDAAGNEGTFQNTAVRSALSVNRKITLAERDLLINALLTCGVIASSKRRDAIVADLRSDIANDIERDPAAKFDVIAMVRTCARFRGGLGELVHVVQYYEGESIAAAQLLHIAEQLQIENV